MSLKEFATPLTGNNHFIKASFGGFAGSGKTRTATEFIKGCYEQFGCKKPILIIDNEKGSRFLIPIFQQAGIEVYVKDTEYLNDVLDAFKLLNSNEIDFLFIDTLTKIWYKFINQYKEKTKINFMTLEHWGKVIPLWQEKFANPFVELTGNCVFTGRGGYQYEMETNENGKKQFIKSGVKMKLAGETPFEPDLNVWMEMEEELQGNDLLTWRTAQILKDRSGVIDSKVFKNPTYNDFKPLIDFMTEIPTGEVARATNTANELPSDDFGYVRNQTEKEIMLEKIKAIYVKYELDGQSAETKKFRTAIQERIFDTTSWTEIEKRRSLDELRNGHNELIYLFEDWLKADDKMEYILNFKRQDEISQNLEEHIQNDALPF